MECWGNELVSVITYIINRLSFISSLLQRNQKANHHEDISITDNLGYSFTSEDTGHSFL